MLHSSEKLISQNNESSLYRSDDGQVKKVIKYRSTVYGIVVPFEVELLHTAHHPYLLSGNGISLDDDKLTIFLPGADYDLLEGAKRGFSHDQLIRFFYQTSLALLALHRQKIAHLDVKSENILIFRQSDDTLVAKLGDFGHARYLPKPQRSLPLGTPLYLSPEFAQASILQEDVLIEPSADLWSLGITFYLLFVNNFEYHLDGDKILTLFEFYRKSECLWSNEKSQESLDLVKHPIIREILANLLTPVTKRWSIEQVVAHLEKIVTPEEHVDLVFAEKPIPKDLEVILTKYCRYLDQDPTPCFLWIRRIITRLNLESFRLDEVAPVLLYFTLMYMGIYRVIFMYLSTIGGRNIFDPFIDLEIVIFKQLYSKPSLDSPQLEEQYITNEGLTG